MKRHAFWLFFACAASCRVPAVDGAAYSGPRNACELGCASGVGCVDGACVAAQTAYPLVFEITPPTTAAFARGVTFTVPIADQKGATDRDIKLDQPARVVAELDDTAGVTLRLRRVDAVPGAARSVFEASSASGSKSTPALTVPPGDYEVFISPTQDSDLATIPPVQLRDDATGLPLVKTFASGAQKLVISYGGLRTIDVTLTDKTGAPLLSATEARDVFVIDDTTGALASTVKHTCTAPGSVTPKVTLTLAPALTGHRYTLRVAPPAIKCAAGAPLATVDFDLQALDVEGRGNQAILAMPPTPSTPTVVGQVVAFGTNAAINDATIILQSQTLDDVTSGHAFIEVRGDVGGASGRFFLDNVLPGTYRATVIPGTGVTLGARPYAICVDCTVPSQDPTAPDGTRVAEFKIDAAHTKLDFQIARRVSVTVGAAGFDGALFGLGTFEADTSSSAFLSTATGSKLITRSETGTLAITLEKGTLKTWNLAAALDPGVYDFVVRTPEASGYPWIVLPRTEVAPAPKLDIGVVKATAPVIFAGHILDPSGAPVPRATLRARALIPDRTDPKKPAIGAVLVGETRAGEDGSYNIVLPSDFATQPPVSK
ncbi:MAG: hypothetical protein ACXVEF_22560 [Polyangiales bacterium]